MGKSKLRGAVYATTKSRRIGLDAKAIGKRIADARKARRWTVKQLSEALGIHESTIHGWTSGNRVPERDSFCLLSVHLRRSVDFLLTGCAKRGQGWKKLASDATVAPGDV